MLLRKLSSHFDSYNYCHKIIKVSFGKHNVGRCILSHSKGFGPKNFPGGLAPRSLQSSAPHIICVRHAAAKYSRNSPNRALQVSVSSKGPGSTSCPGARPRSRRPCLSLLQIMFYPGNTYQTCMYFNCRSCKTRSIHQILPYCFNTL